jgi:thioesterase domain-containing protein
MFMRRFEEISSSQQAQHDILFFPDSTGDSTSIKPIASAFSMQNEERNGVYAYLKDLSLSHLGEQKKIVLAGYSGGGVLALEAGLRLKMHGIEVHLVVIDTPPVPVLQKDLQANNILTTKALVKLLNYALGLAFEQLANKQSVRLQELEYTEQEYIELSKKPFSWQIQTLTDKLRAENSNSALRQPLQQYLASVTQYLSKIMSHPASLPLEEQKLDSIQVVSCTETNERYGGPIVNSWRAYGKKVSACEIYEGTHTALASEGSDFIAEKMLSYIEQIRAGNVKPAKVRLAIQPPLRLAIQFFNDYKALPEAERTFFEDVLMPSARSSRLSNSNSCGELNALKMKHPPPIKH